MHKTNAVKQKATTIVYSDQQSLSFLICLKKYFLWSESDRILLFLPEPVSI